MRIKKPIGHGTYQNAQWHCGQPVGYRPQKPHRSSLPVVDSEAHPLCAIVVAAVLGSAVNRKILDALGQLVFIPGLFLFADTIYESTQSSSFPSTLAAQFHFIVVDAFGAIPGCEGDCFGVIGAIILLPSLAYSVGTFVAIRGNRRRNARRPGLVASNPKLMQSAAPYAAPAVASASVGASPASMPPR